MTTQANLITAKLMTSVEQAYQSNLAFQFALLDHCLRHVEPIGILTADFFQRELAPLKKLNAQEFVSQGTPFFWRNILTGVDDVVDGKADFDNLCRHLLMLAFDAYFEYLPIGTDFTLPVVEGSDIILPKLGIRVFTSGKISVLRRINSKIIEVEGCDRNFCIDLNQIEPEFRLPIIPIPNCAPAVLLMSNSPALFDGEYIDSIEPELPAAVAHAQMIGRSLKFIEKVDSELGLRIYQRIHWYVPIATPFVGTINKSFTNAKINRVIFLSQAIRQIDIAEAIVHEFSHTELFILIDTQDILQEKEGERFYSPWRRDPRPLCGIFHGIYVFSKVANFYARAEKCFADSPEIEYFRKRRLEICHQLQLGIIQIPESRLGNFGRRMISSMKNDLKWHYMDLDAAINSLPAKTKSHLDTWCQEHPELASICLSGSITALI